jgi:fibronectin type 3 domain-containing protein
MPTTSGEDEEEEEEEQQLDYPTNLSASQSGTSIVISWASVIGATGYMVYRSSNPYEPFEVLNSTSVASYTDNAPLSGYNYYKVTAKNSSSESEQSLYVSCNYSAPVTKPSAPTNVYAAQSGTSIVVSWSSVAGATSYRVYYSNDGISYGFFTPVTSTNLTDKSPYSGTNYYKVKAITSFGAESDYSTIASCTFSSAPSTPSTPTGLSAAANGYMITVRWNSVSGATYYKVAWSRTAAGTYTDLSPQYTVTSFTDDQQWNLGYNYYKVKACNASGCSSYSSYVSAYASNNSGGNEGGGTAYPAPTGVSMIYMGSYNIVSWNAASGATGYTVYRSNGNSGPWAEVEIIVGKTEYKDYGGSYSSCYKVGATYSSAIPSDLSKSSCD